jgi:photosystem II stability/assembly factor-like uncharacterized protein
MAYTCMGSRGNSILFSFLITLMLGAPSLAAEREDRVSGRWQGGHSGAEDKAPREPAPVTSRFLLLDTGGSGGSFGKGDLRHDLQDVAFWTDGRQGAACGCAGAFYTADGGLTWKRIKPHPRKQYPEETGVTYYHIELAGPREIWLTEGKHPCVGRRLWHSTDAGATWEDAAGRFPGALESAWDLLARGDHVWLLGGWAPRASFRSEDGGRTWTRLEIPEGVEPYKAATPADQPLTELGTVYLLGARRQGRTRIPALFRRDAGGDGWDELVLPGAEQLPWGFSHATLAFGTTQTGMIGLDAPGLRFPKHGVFEKESGESASVLVTADGGRTWTRRRLPNEELMVSAVWCSPNRPRHALAAVWNKFVSQIGGPRRGPALYETFDSGKTWGIAVQGASQVNAVFGLNSRRVWAVGDKPGFAKNDVVAIMAEPAGTE